MIDVKERDCELLETKDGDGNGDGDGDGESLYKIGTQIVLAFVKSLTGPRI